MSDTKGTQPTPRLRLLTASKYVEPDSYKHGCTGEVTHRDLAHSPGTLYPDAVAVIRDLVRHPGEVLPEHVGIMDNNLYVDVKGGGSRVVSDNQAKGRFRATYDRLETARGHVPDADTRKAWEHGIIPHLMLARYEFEFELVFAGLNEQQVATLAGCTCWP